MLLTRTFYRQQASVILLLITAADHQHRGTDDSAGSTAASYLESTFSRYELLTMDNVSADANTSSEIQLTVNIFNRTYRIRETDNDWDSSPVFEPNAAVVFRGVDGTIHRVPAINYLKGYMVGQSTDDRGSSFYGWYDGKRVSGGRAASAVDGILELDYGADLIFIESTAGFLAECAPYWHMVDVQAPPHVVLAYRPAHVYTAKCRERNASSGLGGCSCCNRPAGKAESPLPENGDANIRVVKRSVFSFNKSFIQTCVIKVVVDPSFVRRVGASSYNRSVAEIVTHVHFANRVLARTEFGSGIPFLQLSLGEIEIVEHRDPSASFSSFQHLGGDDDDDVLTIGADTYLTNVVARMHQMSGNFCIGLYLTYRSFSDGSFGAAHRATDIASHPHNNRDTAGESGFCTKPIVAGKIMGVGQGRRLTFQRSSKFYYPNTAVVSFGGVPTGRKDTPVGFKAPRATTMVRFLHHLGHLLGSHHEGADPAVSGLEERLGCIRSRRDDGSADKPFLMSSDTDPASLAANWSFSVCSRAAMATALRDRFRTGCPRFQATRGGGIGVGGRVRFKVKPRSYSRRISDFVVARDTPPLLRKRW